MKRSFCIFLMLLVSLCLYAVELNMDWTWEVEDPEVNYYRYQINGQEDNSWTVVDSSVTSYSVEGLDATIENVFYLQQSYDGNNWSDSIVYECDVIIPSAVELFEPIDIGEKQFIYNVETKEESDSSDILDKYKVAEVEDKEVPKMVISESIKEKPESNFNLALSMSAGYGKTLLDLSKTNIFVPSSPYLNNSFGIGLENMFSSLGLKFKLNTSIDYTKDLKSYLELSNYNFDLDCLLTLGVANFSNSVINLSFGSPVLGFNQVSNKIVRNSGLVVELAYRYDITEAFGLGFELVGKIKDFSDVKTNANLAFTLNI